MGKSNGTSEENTDSVEQISVPGVQIIVNGDSAISSADVKPEPKITKFDGSTVRVHIGGPMDEPIIDPGTGGPGGQNMPVFQIIIGG